MRLWENIFTLSYLFLFCSFVIFHIPGSHFVSVDVLGMILCETVPSCTACHIPNALSVDWFMIYLSINKYNVNETKMKCVTLDRLAERKWNSYCSYMLFSYSFCWLPVHVFHPRRICIGLICICAYIIMFSMKWQCPLSTWMHLALIFMMQN